jgi:hypothetical protein
LIYFVSLYWCYVARQYEDCDVMCQTHSASDRKGIWYFLTLFYTDLHASKFRIVHYLLLCWRYQSTWIV